MVTALHTMRGFDFPIQLSDMHKAPRGGDNRLPVHRRSNRGKIKFRNKSPGLGDGHTYSVSLLPLPAFIQIFGHVAYRSRKQRTITAMRYFKIEASEVNSLEDKVFLITGASSGIGLATAELFLRKGANAVVIADTECPPEDLDSRVLYIRADVTVCDDLRLLFAATIEKYGRIDVVFANAGIVDRSDYVSLREEDGKVLEPDRRSLDVNLSGCLNSVALVIHHMQK
ncbi:uncharacterized protein PV06_00726 [Exophiala oligosperma]|uniref:Uncharacterized protein n=1 Tax=Exophiala oligosperma TaxID=215243 RepID=A0A0D2CE29_9EURO|nr:uncharacterized protein PV06_00726 [Exophiala oligosperma]KIW48107.1 hypothetical protein PV06_00726 [Exophiala oligosperma]